MKTKTFGLVALLAIGCLALAGCNKTENPDEKNVGMANPASVYCEEQWGTLQIETAEDGSQSWICLFKDGSYCEEWSYYRDECQPGEIIYNTVEAEEDYDYTLPEWAKTSLTNEELDELAETHFPKWYSYSTFNMAENLIGDEWEYTYPEDLSHTLLLPEHATMASREVLSSGIEDGMIYTLTKVTLQDDTTIDVLYIVDPVTLDFVAASVENGNISTNYQFVY